MERPVAEKLPDEEVVDRFVGDIVAAVQPLRIILFGSRARAEAGGESDIDLLVVMPEGTDQREVSGRLYRDIPRQGTTMGVLVTTPSVLERHRDSPGLIYRTILEEGRAAVQGSLIPLHSRHPAALGATSRQRFDAGGRSGSSGADEVRRNLTVSRRPAPGD